MALTLVIAEKPSVAQTIAAALGVKEKKDGYIEGGGCLISWCVEERRIYRGEQLAVSAAVSGI
ncbi:MAG: hypothetical protein L6V89_00070 [Oscillospiraceae bacterium]|nr:MAG: hypothetical protein L6V89_00070 [Oscillospiraceae bacterium]